MENYFLWLEEVKLIKSKLARSPLITLSREKYWQRRGGSHKAKYFIPSWKLPLQTFPGGLLPWTSILLFNINIVPQISVVTSVVVKLHKPNDGTRYPPPSPGVHDSYILCLIWSNLPNSLVILMSWFLLAKYVIGGVGVGLLNISYNSARLMWWWAKIINHCTHFGFAINLPVGANLI